MKHNLAIKAEKPKLTLKEEPWKELNKANEEALLRVEAEDAAYYSSNSDDNASAIDINS